jgi:hypothetical protein
MAIFYGSAAVEQCREQQRAEEVAVPDVAAKL